MFLPVKSLESRTRVTQPDAARAFEVAMHRLLVTLLLWACALVASAAQPQSQSLSSYHDNAGRADAWSGGVVFGF